MPDISACPTTAVNPPAQRMVLVFLWYHLYICVCTQLCPTLCDPVNCSPPGSSPGVPSGGSWLPMWYQGHSHAGRAWILGDPGRRPGARGPCSVACPLDFHPAASGACLIGPLGPLHPVWVTQVSVGLAAAATEPGRLCFSSTVSLSYLTLKTMSNGFPGKNVGVGGRFLLQGIFQPRDQTCISCVSCVGRQILYH